jgi:hypothetical protein
VSGEPRAAADDRVVVDHAVVADHHTVVNDHVRPEPHPGAHGGGGAEHGFGEVSHVPQATRQAGRAGLPSNLIAAPVDAALPEIRIL